MNSVTKEVIRCVIVLGVLFLLAIMIGRVTCPKYHCTWPRDFCVCRNPMSCNIEWEDGTHQFKSRSHSLGTLMPGESKEVKFDIWPVDPNIDMNNDGDFFIDSCTFEDMDPNAVIKY